MSASRRRLQRTGIVAAAALSLAGIYAMPANAVHDEGIFQLDGNASTADQSTPAAAEDWDLICKAHQPTSTPPGPCVFDDDYDTSGLGTTTASPSSFATDGFDADTDTIYTTGGSKDDLDISSWKFKNAKPSPSKDDLEHSFAAEYVCTTAIGCTDNNNDKFLYFGADRFDNEGDANIAFWFLQADVKLGGTGPDGTACTSGSGCSFSGSHRAHGAGPDGYICYPGQTGQAIETVPLPNKDCVTGPAPLPGADDTRGDILVVSAFTNGGVEPNISAYEWVGIGNAPNALKVTSGRSVVPIPLSPANLSQGCATPALEEDAACAMVNADEEVAPWVYRDKDVQNQMFQQGELYEGGLNLTKLGLAKTCFSNFLVNTRSSQSVDATLKDFTLGPLAQCQSSLVTTPKVVNGASADNIPAGGTSITTAGSIQVKDSANLTVSGIDTWTGNLKFFLCGPPSMVVVQGQPAPTCDGTTGKVGTQIGAAAGLTVTQATSNPILSDAATITSVGRYCWRGVFTSGTDGVDSKTDSTTGECFVVNPVTPTLTTVASNSAPGSAQTFGQAIDDTATLTGTARQPTNPAINPAAGVLGSLAGGTITFKLYGPSDLASGNCTDPATGVPGNLVATSVVNVSGDSVDPTNLYKASNGTITGNGGTLIPPSPGHYWWTASYSGSSPNTTGAPLTAGGAVTFTACDDTTEDSFVEQIPTAISTSQSAYPNDSATISTASGSVNGSVAFKLFRATAADGATPAATALQNCTSNTSQGLSFSQTKTLAAGVASSKSVSTNNGDPGDGVTDFSATADGSYVWRVTFTSSDVSHTGRQSVCVENTVLTFNNDSGPGTLFTPSP
jgi:hypothetical protein